MIAIARLNVLLEYFNILIVCSITIVLSDCYIREYIIYPDSWTIQDTNGNDSHQF